MLGNVEGIFVLPSRQPRRSRVTARLVCHGQGWGSLSPLIPHAHPTCLPWEGVDGVPGSRGGSGGSLLRWGGVCPAPHGSHGRSGSVPRAVALTPFPAWAHSRGPNSGILVSRQRNSDRHCHLPAPRPSLQTSPKTTTQAGLRQGLNGSPDFHSAPSP